MGLEIVDLPKLNSLFSIMLRDLPRLDDKVGAQAANSLWLNKGIVTDPEFTALLEKDYGSTVSVIDFKDVAAADSVRRWYAARTGVKKEKFGSLPQEGVFMLNAFNLSASWERRFDEKKTVPGRFNNIDGSSSEIMMMNGQNIALYFEDMKYQWIRMDLGELESFDICFILPKDRVRLESVLTAANLLGEGIERMTTTVRCNLMLPRITFDDLWSMSDLFRLQGIEKLFSDDAPLSGVIDGKPYLEFNQCLTSSFDEEGSKTEVASGNGKLDPTDPYPVTVDVRIDRPFAYAIRERSTGAILVMGRIVRI